MTAPLVSTWTREPIDPSQIKGFDEHLDADLFARVATGRRYGQLWNRVAESDLARRLDVVADHLVCWHSVGTSYGYSGPTPPEVEPLVDLRDFPSRTANR